MRIPFLVIYFLAKYKFRVRYTGQKTTCGYRAENDHLERNCTKKQNMITLVRNSKLEKRLGKQTNEAETSNPPTTQEEAKKSFEDQPQTFECISEPILFE